MTEAERLAMINLWHAMEFVIKHLELTHRDQGGEGYYEIVSVREMLQEGHRDFLASGG